jgi:hypothetical protein
MSVWIFKNGQREKGLNFLDESSSDAARSSKGYRGYLQFLSEEDPNCATIITLWESNEARKNSSKGVFKNAAKGLEPYIECPPDVSNFKLSVNELRI